MRAENTGFITRSAAGLKKPTAYSSVVSGVGITFHYNGPKMTYSPHPDPARCGCRVAWRGIQSYHMNIRGFRDVAYTGATCMAGHCLAGRGYGRRTAAQGTTRGNDEDYAICGLFGVGQYPTPEMLRGLTWWVKQLRSLGTGRRNRPHSAWKNTACPGALIPLIPRLEPDTQGNEDDVIILYRDTDDGACYVGNYVHCRHLPNPTAYHAFGHAMGEAEKVLGHAVLVKIEGSGRPFDWLGELVG